MKIQDKYELIKTEQGYRIEGDVECAEDLVIDLDAPLYVRGHIRAEGDINVGGRIIAGGDIDAGGDIVAKGGAKK